MKKMAIFVEGQSELAFTEVLIKFIAGEKSVHIDQVRCYGGSKKNSREFIQVNAQSIPDPENKFYFLIYDCGTDSKVLSDIRDRYQNLVSQGFQSILGIRDVYPKPSQIIPSIRENFRKFAPNSPVQTSLILEIREIEAWFIAEHTHFLRMNRDLTTENIQATVGYDPTLYDSQSIQHPADDLLKIYNLQLLDYDKSLRHVRRTIACLDFSYIYHHLSNLVPDIGNLTRTIEEFVVQ